MHLALLAKLQVALPEHNSFFMAKAKNE
uniref:Uncharacterized protein n=1 Tax=Rhizophora mucronata TaxID=61149 RepID=A0A2P2N5N4_RHIMU